MDKINAKVTVTMNVTPRWWDFGEDDMLARVGRVAVALSKAHAIQKVIISRGLLEVVVFAPIDVTASALTLLRDKLVKVAQETA